MFQRCVAMVFASTGATVGRDPPSFVIAPQASADPAASMVSLNPSSEIALHFTSFFIAIIFLKCGQRCLLILFDRDDPFGPEFLTFNLPSTLPHPATVVYVQ